MNKRFIAVLVFAFIVASGASILLYRLMANRQPAAAAAPATIRLILAARNLEIGTLVKEADIRVADWPGAVPVGAIVKKEDLIGRGVVAPIFANEPVVESRMAPKGAGGGLAAMIPKGMRAVAVRVNEIIGVAGFVVPGMHVDVLISGSPPGGSAALGTLTKTLLQNIEVLSAGQEFHKDAEGKPMPVPVINLLVTPEQAERLSLAGSQTTIQLVLRNPLDHEVATTPGTAVSHLFAGTALKPTPVRTASAATPHQRALPKAPAPLPQSQPRETPKPFVMEIIQGTKRVETKFDRPGEARP